MFYRYAVYSAYRSTDDTARCGTTLSHCAPRSHHIPRHSAVPHLGPLRRVQNFEEQKHRPEHLRGMFHQLRLQFLTRPGHMQHASSFPARLKHRPPVSSHLYEKKTLFLHGGTSQMPNERPSCKNTCTNSVQVDASNHVEINVRRRAPEPYEVSPRAPRFFASTPATCTSSEKF